MKWLVLVLAGCGPYSSSPPPAQPTLPAPVIEPAPPAPVAADPPPAPVEAPAVDPECRGAHLDLRTLVMRNACVVEGDPEPLPPAIAISIEPSTLTLKSGAELPAAIVLTNTATTETTVQVRPTCGRSLTVDYQMLGADGRRVDLENTCSAVASCRAPTRRFALPPRGQLRLEFPIAARMERYDESCNGARIGPPVPKGVYELRVYSRFPEQRTRITIE